MRFGLGNQAFGSPFIVPGLVKFGQETKLADLGDPGKLLNHVGNPALLGSGKKKGNSTKS